MKHFINRIFIIIRLFYFSANIQVNNPAPAPSFLPPTVRQKDIGSSFQPGITNRFNATIPSNDPEANVQISRVAVSPLTWYSPHAKAAAHRMRMKSETLFRG